MASSVSSPNYTSIACPSCNVTVTQTATSRRTICPHCGSFYDTAVATSIQMEGRYPEALPQLRHDKTKERVGGFQTITNFFSNLTKSRRNSRQSSEDGAASAPLVSTSTSYTLPHIHPECRGILLAQCHVNNGKPNSAGYHWPVPLEIEVYDIKMKTALELRADIERAKESDDYKEILEFYSAAFDSFQNMNTVFKKNPGKEGWSIDDPGIKLDLVSTAYDYLESLPQEIQRVVLRCMINMLLKDKRPHTKDDLRAYFILIQNPLFSRMSTYVIFAHLLRQVAALSDADHQCIIFWLKKIDAEHFKAIIHRILQFITIRLFPPHPQDLPPRMKCSWWIPSATKVLALFNAANNLCRPSKVHYSEFYNSALDYPDHLMAEYHAWQNPGPQGGFSFCQYPFILSISAKRTILQRDSEQQMIINARRSLVAKVQKWQVPDIGLLFLNLTVRRSHLVSDSLSEIARKQQDLKKKLKVTFAGEPGLDMGGLTKEWFLLLTRRIFKPEYGMFTHDEKSKVCWFRTGGQYKSLREFHLVGVLMGLAMYNSIILDVRFPPCCYRKLLSPPVVPSNPANIPLGVCPLTLDDFEQVMPDVTRGLRELLQYEGSVENDFGVTFEVTVNEFGVVKGHPLKHQGENIPVTNENRKEYVDNYIDWMLNKAIYQPFRAFYLGFHSVCASNALIMLRPEEVELLVCGSPNLDLTQLKKVAQYDGYNANDPVVKNFWDILFMFSKSLQKQFLLFTTGSDRIPVGGMEEMNFKITRIEPVNNLLPMAHTCFNQLILPAYRSRKVMRSKLIIAISNAEGFGLE